MKKIPFIACILILLVGAFPASTLAARGTPDSAHFGYGLRLDVNGVRVEEAVLRAAQMELDWVALDFDWNAAWPDPNHWGSDTSFGRAARLADTLGLSLVFSIQNPPDWAMTPYGPHPELTAALLCDLKQLFPNLKAVELYPRANTRAGWGATPDPVRYALLLQAARTRLENRQISLYLLAGGLTNQLLAPEDQADTVFLQGLYDAGARPEIISLRLEGLTGMPDDEPSAVNTLRHFEQIRGVMNANGQSQALVWVTGFGLPDELAASTSQEQSEWLTQSYRLMRSRLYFGASFYTCYNVLPSATSDQACLIKQDGSKHPFLAQLDALIDEN
jgi:hypothetical protein